MQVDLARGYSHPQLHNLSATAGMRVSEASWAEHEPLLLANCTRAAQRFRADQFVVNETKVAAVRISTNGWEASILNGLEVSKFLVSVVKASLGSTVTCFAIVAILFSAMREQDQTCCSQAECNWLESQHPEWPRSECLSAFFSFWGCIQLCLQCCHKHEVHLVIA